MINVPLVGHPHAAPVRRPGEVTEFVVRMFVSRRSVGWEDVVLELLVRLIEDHDVVIGLLQLLVLVVVTGGAGSAAFLA